MTTPKLAVRQKVFVVLPKNRQYAYELVVDVSGNCTVNDHAPMTVTKVGRKYIRCSLDGQTYAGAELVFEYDEKEQVFVEDRDWLSRAIMLPSQEAFAEYKQRQADMQLISAFPMTYMLKNMSTEDLATVAKVFGKYV